VENNLAREDMHLAKYTLGKEVEMDRSHSSTYKWKIDDECTTLDSQRKETTETTSKFKTGKWNQAPFRSYMDENSSSRL